MAYHLKVIPAVHIMSSFPWLDRAVCSNSISNSQPFPPCLHSPWRLDSLFLSISLLARSAYLMVLLTPFALLQASWIHPGPRAGVWSSPDIFVLPDLQPSRRFSCGRIAAAQRDEAAPFNARVCQQQQQSQAAHQDSEQRPGLQRFDRCLQVSHAPTTASLLAMALTQQSGPLLSRLQCAFAPPTCRHKLPLLPSRPFCMLFQMQQGLFHLHVALGIT